MVTKEITMRRLIQFAFFFGILSAIQCAAQTAAFYSLPQKYPNAVVRVCPVVVANPCPSPSSIFSDQALSQGISNPFQVGSDGSFGFWIAGGQYTIQIGSPYNQVFTVTIGGGGGGSGTVNNCGTIGGVGYFAATGTAISCDASATSNGSGTFNAVGFSASGLITTSGSFSTTGTAVATFQNGSALAPSIVFPNGNYGFYSNSSTAICLGTGLANTGPYCFTTGSLRGNSGLVYGWTLSATNPQGAIDTGLSRDSAGVVDCGTGAAASKACLFQAKRYTVDGATTLVSGDFALSAGWGTTASVAITNSNSKDSAAVVTVTSAGTGQAANPTITLTFHDGTWGATASACTLLQNGGNDIFGDVTGVTAAPGITLAGTWNGTPTATKTYQFLIQCLGD